eukprot:TRINITY_DN65938_c7_g4_i1.p1 TRINITY_DN65938_c7_g4~~TRINITY_DN65938_c7_g4_i1.p1  ORF type:complete len:704 (+),score=104.16 TRINITY_DN65938_c7_g4_i1:34-2145(+)
MGDPATLESSLIDEAAEDDEPKKEIGKDECTLVSVVPKFKEVCFGPAQSIVFGRNKDSSVVFQDARISGKHCKMYFEGVNVYAHDFSSNGTFVNGTKLGQGKRAELKPGDEISLALPAAKIMNADLPVYIFRRTRSLNFEDKQEGVYKEYHVGQTIGSGTFGQVKLGRHKKTDAEVALKIIGKKQFGLQPNFNINSLKTEINILKKLDHPNIIKIYDMFDTETELVLVLELVKDGDLFDAIVERQKFSEEASRELFWQLCSALDYLHNMGIAHRDLKPENLLVHKHKRKDGESITLKVTDFGLAKFCSGSSLMKTKCGTPLYTAPEVLSGHNPDGYTKCVDMWSIGIILYVLLSGTPPSIKGNQLTFGKEMRFVSNSAKDLIKQLLQRDPVKRITVSQAISHAWMLAEVPPMYRHVLKGQPINLPKSTPTDMLPPSSINMAKPKTKQQTQSPPKDKVSLKHQLQGRDGDGNTDKPKTPPPTTTPTPTTTDEKTTPITTTTTTTTAQDEEEDNDLTPKDDQGDDTDVEDSVMYDDANKQKAAMKKKHEDVVAHSHKFPHGSIQTNLNMQSTTNHSATPSPPPLQKMTSNPNNVSSDDNNGPPSAVSSDAKAFSEPAHWFWKNDLEIDDTKEDAWKPYSMEESSRVEEAYKKKKRTAKVNAEYRIAFEEGFQYRVDDGNKQRPVVRGTVFGATESGRAVKKMRVA